MSDKASEPSELLGGRAVAESLSSSAPATWVPRDRMLDRLVRADASLRDELDAALPDTIEES